LVIAIGLFFFIGFLLSPTLGIGQEQPKKSSEDKKFVLVKKGNSPLKKKAKVIKDLKFEKIN
jgi:hypothetical protein